MNEEPHIGITEHARMRARERMHIRNIESLRRTTLKAMICGMPRAEAKGNLAHWLDSRSASHQSFGNMTVIHHGIVFVIHDSVLITVLYLPADYQAQVAKWLAKHPPGAGSSGSLKDPHSGVVTPESAQTGLKKVKKALKAPVLGSTQPGGEV